MQISPLRVLSLTAVAGAAMAVLAVLFALAIPQVDLDDGQVPLAVRSAEGAIEIVEGDLLEEPDVLPDQQTLDAFFVRQGQITSALSQPGAVVVAEGADSAIVEIEPRKRELSDLPFAFWYQIIVGIAALLIGGWVYALRPKDWGVRMFALTGVSVPVFAMAAAVYSTRSLAMDGTVFHWLSSINHIGAGSFGIALVGLFLMYPRPLVPPRWLLVPVIAYGIAIAGDVFDFLPHPLFGMAIVSQMLIAIVLGIVQWWRSRRQPLDRAGLRWFFLATLVGSSLFIAMRVVPPLIGLDERFVLSQGYAFGFFLFMHVGLALGLLRYRVFDLDRLAYGIWMWFGGALLVILIDFAIVGWLNTQPWSSLTLALLIAGFVYFPLRQMLLSRFLEPKRAVVDNRMSEVIAMAFAPDDTEREQQWTTILDSVFEPLETVDGSTRAIAAPAIAENGLELEVSSAAGCGPRVLRLANHGRRLFTPHDVEAVSALCDMATIASESRQAYDFGAISERERISKDMHDSIGAHLLSALHTIEPDRKNALLRETLGELRSIVNSGKQAPLRLADVLADLRAEAADRLALAGMELDWDTHHPDAPLSLPGTNALRAIVREAVSNIVKHSNADRVRVLASVAANELTLEIADNGGGLATHHLPGEECPGNGKANIGDRALSLGGTAKWGPAQWGSADEPAQADGRPGCALTVRFPVNAARESRKLMRNV